MTAETEQEQRQPHLAALELVSNMSFPVGRKLLSEILTGKPTERIKKLGLDRNSCFGALCLYAEKDIQALLNKMIFMGLIEIKRSPQSGFYPVICMTDKGRMELANPTEEKQGATTDPHSRTIITDEDRALFCAFGSFLEKYNDEQKKAIICPKERICCIAGAGSGKTTVLIRRIEFLAKLRGISPKKILAITFTRKARQEMMARLSGTGIDADIETFNSFCEKIVRKHGDKIYDRDFVVMDFRAKISLVNKALTKLDYTMDEAINLYFTRQKQMRNDRRMLSFALINDAFSLIDHYHNNGKEISEFRDEIRPLSASDKHTALFLAGLMENILLLKKQLGLRDYTDQIRHAIRLFKLFPRTIPEYDHILVDEYQDVNQIQVEMLELLCPKNLFVVGDPRQAIFGWRGSKMENIISFPRKHPDAEIVQLTKNYRSGKCIVAAANAMIAGMKLPDIEPISSDETKVTLISHADEHEEHMFVATSILSQQMPRNRIFVLARTNKQLENLSQLFEQHGISFLKRTVEEKQENMEPAQDQVTLSTVHAIKGLEADLVYVIGVSAQMYPCMASEHPVMDFAKSDSSYDKFEEELRLLYVAMTRAKKRLVLSYHGSASCFISSQVRSCLEEVSLGGLSKFSAQPSKAYKINKSSSASGGSDVVSKLRSYRMAKAQELNLMPYMIFSDKTMHLIAEAMPQDRYELETINGIGPSKIRRFGNDILDIVFGRS